MCQTIGRLLVHRWITYIIFLEEGGVLHLFLPSSCSQNSAGCILIVLYLKFSPRRVAAVKFWGVLLFTCSPSFSWFVRCDNETAVSFADDEICAAIGLDSELLYSKSRWTSLLCVRVCLYVCAVQLWFRNIISAFTVTAGFKWVGSLCRNRCSPLHGATLWILFNFKTTASLSTLE